MDLVNVNGNVCKAVIKEGCTFDADKFTCILSKENNNCNTPFLNLPGCLLISTST